MRAEKQIQEKSNKISVGILVAQTLQVLNLLPLW